MNATGLGACWPLRSALALVLNLDVKSGAGAGGRPCAARASAACTRDWDTMFPPLTDPTSHIRVPEIRIPDP
eukprot:scaffold141141_cov35-Tisochrysis_lutea.AAC.1